MTWPTPIRRMAPNDKENRKVVGDNKYAIHATQTKLNCFFIVVFSFWR